MSSADSNMGKTIYNYNEYISKKLQGEDVISVASVYGANAIHTCSDDFIVIEAESEHLSLYEYKVKDGKFHVSKHIEHIPCNFQNILSTEMMNDANMLAWWKEVFYYNDSKYTYDSFYDNLKIADDNEQTFRSLLNNTKSLLREANVTPTHANVFVTGINSNPLVCYAIDELFNENMQCTVKPLKIENLDINEDDCISADIPQLDTVNIAVNGGLTLRYFTQEVVKLALPLTDVVLQSYVCQQIKWSDLFEQEAQEDYSACNYKLKYLNIHVEYDAFQNIFLICSDILGNKSIKML